MWNRLTVKNIRLIDEIMGYDKTEYFSHALIEVVNGANSNEWILVTRYMIDK